MVLFLNWQDFLLLLCLSGLRCFPSHKTKKNPPPLQIFILSIFHFSCFTFHCNRVGQPSLPMRRGKLSVGVVNAHTQKPHLPLYIAFSCPLKSHTWHPISSWSSLSPNSPSLAWYQNFMGPCLSLPKGW